MKKLFYSLLITILLALGVYGQIPTIKYSVMDASTNCETGKVCYTIGVESNTAGYYLDVVTFRYFIDPTIFVQPTAADHEALPLSGSGVEQYYFTLDATGQPIIGDEMGFNTDASLWPRGTIFPTDPTNNGRLLIGTTPTPILKICLTPIIPLENASSLLCYPFIFDSNFIRFPDFGIAPNTSGIASTYTTTPNTITQSLSAYDGVSQPYAWIPNMSWDGRSFNLGPESVGSVATEGCMINTCATCEVLPTGDPQPTYVGISTLDRNVNEWLATDNPDGQENLLSAYIALESSNKAFVITRNASPGLYKEDDPATTTVNIANPVEGMVVWDTTKNCLSLYKVDETGGYWSCVSQGCNQ